MSLSYVQCNYSHQLTSKVTLNNKYKQKQTLKHDTTLQVEKESTLKRDYWVEDEAKMKGKGQTYLLHIKHPHHHHHWQKRLGHLMSF